MLTQIKQQLEEQILIKNGKQCLLAVSGGVDSMVLLDIMRQTNIPFSVAHVNYNLRQSSIEDAKLVAQVCDAHQIVRHTLHVTDHHYQNVQSWARDLRYDFFEKLCHVFNYDVVITAQHADDQRETYLLSVFRGKQAQGMKVWNAHIYRPLLEYDKSDIVHYAEKFSIQYREDESNQKTKYDRNFLRQNIIPQLQTKFPHFNQKIDHSISRSLDNIGLLDHLVNEKLSQFILKKHNYISINKSIIQEEQCTALLFHYVKKWGFSFSDVQDIIQSKNIGAQIESQDHLIINGRDAFLMGPRIQSDFSQIIPLEKFPLTENIYDSISISMEQIDHKSIDFTDKTTLYFDSAKVKWPLEMRSKNDGDTIQLLGMNGYKKIKKHYTDLKLNYFEKQRQVVLIDARQEIIALPGLNISETCKIDDSTTQVVMIKFEII